MCCMVFVNLEGILNWTDFCKKHGNEYILPFWDARGDPSHMRMRLSKAWTYEIVHLIDYILHMMPITYFFTYIYIIYVVLHCIRLV